MVLAGMVLVIYIHCCLSFLIWDVAPSMETRHLQTSTSIHSLLHAKISHDSVIKNDDELSIYEVPFNSNM
jgi:hypothetical protein